MSLKRIKNDLAPIVLPQGPPVESVREYFISKKELTDMKFIPEQDPVGRVFGINKARAHREYESAKEELAKTLDENVESREYMNAKWKKLAEHQSEFRDAFIKFNRFILENDDKRKRAAERLTRDEAELKIKFEEEKALKAEVEKMEAMCSEMEPLLEKYSVYEKYLMSVVDEYDEFKTPMDIINRFEALKDAKDELSRRQQNDLEQLEEACTDINKILDDKKMKISGLNNTLSELRQRYIKAKTESKRWESLLNKLKEDCAKREIDLFRVQESLWSLYTKICKNKGIPASCKKYDYEGQFVVVMRGLNEIRTIVRKAEERAKQDISSEQVQISSRN